ncbi:MAG: methyltransferase domain-containing protein [Cyanobacteria bacterium P01_F01_bin.116]
MMAQPFLHTTPGDALVNTIEERVGILLPCGLCRQFQVLLPTSVDTLLDHPATHAAFEQDEYMPYWAELWPSALMLGQEIAQYQWPVGYRVLEVGCGLGVSGLVALALGMDVIFSDYDVAALEFAARNAKRNGFDRFRTVPLDWRFPPNGLQVPMVLAADVIYEARNIQPLIGLMDVVLSPGGECWLADPDRPHKQDFQNMLIDQGFEFEAMARRLVRPDKPTVQGTVYRIWRAGAN